MRRGATKNPRGRHLPGLGAKAQRQYEHILASELERGATLRDAKRIAAATVRKLASNPIYTVEAIPKYKETIKEDDVKALTRGSAIRKVMRKVPGPKNIYRYRVERNPQKYYDLIIKGQAEYTPHGWKIARRVIPQGRGVIKLTGNYYLDRHTGYVYAKRERANPKKRGPMKRGAQRKRNESVSEGFWRDGKFHPIRAADDYDPEAVGERHQYAPAGRKRSAKRATKKTKRAAPAPKRVAKRATAKAPAKRASSKRRRNPVTVPGWTSQQLRKLTGLHIKYSPVNQAYFVMWQDQVLRIAETKADAITEVKYLVGHKTAAQYKASLPEQSNPRRKGMHGAYAKLHRMGVKRKSYLATSRRGIRKLKSNPRRKGMHGAYAKLHRMGVKRKSYLATSRREMRKRNQVTPEDIRQEFAGAVHGERDLYFPEGTPQGLAKLGKLVSITTEEGTIKPVAGTAWLCADTHGQLHLGSVSGAPLYDGPPRDFGEVSKLEYEDVKHHLGYTKPTIFFHHVGEKNGIRPSLYADGRGGLVFRGGDYFITSRGLEN